MRAEFVERWKNIHGHDHKPVQHRDGKPPWCNECGLTAGGSTPESRLKG